VVRFVAKNKFGKKTPPIFILYQYKINEKLVVEVEES
jgi:hypothetical protein